jgi:sugar transferase (PEP-CTERM/EpsH1 system associated)
MHVVDSLGKGGLESGLVNVIRHLDDSDQFEHIVVAMRRLGPNADRLSGSAARLLCLYKENSGSRFQIPALFRVIRECRPDVVHSRNWAAIEAVVAARLARCGAIVHSEHGLESDGNVPQPRRRIWFRRLAFELADRVVSVSYQLKDLHTRHTGFAPRKVTVIHNGVDSRRFRPDSNARPRMRRQLGIGDGQFCAGSVGNLLPVKDHATLLKAFGAIRGHADWRLLLAGEGPERAKLQAFVDAHPEWSRQVTFLGSSDQVPALLNALDVYVLPSITEGISNSLLEAMATGLPVVVTATGGNPEVVTDGESGLLVPVGDFHELAMKLSLLRSREDLRRRLREAALQRVRSEFSIESMIHSYRGLYQDLAGGKAVPLQAMARA